MMVSKTHEIKEFFDDMAKSRDKEFRDDEILAYEQKMRQDIISAFVEPRTNDTILDIGCGNGRDALLLAEQKNHFNYVGLDISPNMLKEAARKLPDERFGFLLGDATNLPFCSLSCDYIICSEVLEHIPNWRKSLSEFKRCLKIGAYLIITTPNIISFYGVNKAIYEKRRRGRSHPYDVWKKYPEIKNGIEDEGFKIIDYCGVCYLPGMLSYFPRMKRRIIRVIPMLENLEKGILQRNTVTKYFGYMMAFKARSI